MAISEIAGVEGLYDPSALVVHCNQTIEQHGTGMWYRRIRISKEEECSSAHGGKPEGGGEINRSSLNSTSK